MYLRSSRAFSSLLMTKVVDLATMPVELFVAAGLYALGAVFLWRMLNEHEPEYAGPVTASTL